MKRNETQVIALKVPEGFDPGIEFLLFEFEKIFHIFDFLQRAGEMYLSPWDQIPCPELLAPFSAF